MVSHTYALEAMGVPQSVIQNCASDPDLAEVPPPTARHAQGGFKGQQRSQVSDG